MIAWTVTRTLRTHGRERALVRPALFALALVATQITLGALTIWTRKAVLPTTLHVATGAAILAIQDGTEQITRELLDLVPVDHAAQRATNDRPRRRTAKGKPLPAGGGCRSRIGRGSR